MRLTGGTIRLFSNLYNHGNGQISGTVTIAPDSIPAIRRVRLCSRITGVFLSETWSDAQGNYLFNNIDPGQDYVVYSLDHTGQHNAAIADRPPVEPMP